MISIVTTSTVSAVTTVALAASLGLLAVVALLILLVQKEIISSASDSRGQTFGRVLNVAIVPLFLVFLFLVAVKVAEALRDAGLKVETDFRNEKINYKVREHSLAKVPAIIAIGAREAEQGTVSIRRLGSKHQTSMTLEEAIASLVEEAIPPDVRRKRDALLAAE